MKFKVINKVWESQLERVLELQAAEGWSLKSFTKTHDLGQSACFTVVFTRPELPVGPELDTASSTPRTPQGFAQHAHSKGWKMKTEAEKKAPVDTVNIWYSPQVDRWNVCALVLLQDGNLKRTKACFPTFEQAVLFASSNFKGAKTEGCGV